MTEIGSPGDVTRRWLTTYVLAAVALLFVGGLVGWAIATQMPSSWLQQQASGSTFFPDEITFQNLLINNAIAVTVMTLGAVSFGLVTGFSLLVNGALIGFVVQLALRETSASQIIWLLVPHGVFEIPALLIAAAIGLRFGHRTVRYLRGRIDSLVTTRELKEAGALYALSLLLLVPAAWIEANYTLRVAEAMA